MYTGRWGGMGRDVGGCGGCGEAVMYTAVDFHKPGCPKRWLRKTGPYCAYRSVINLTGSLRYAGVSPIRGTYDCSLPGGAVGGVVGFSVLIVAIGMHVLRWRAGRTRACIWAVLMLLIAATLLMVFVRAFVCREGRDGAVLLLIALMMAL